MNYSTLTLTLTEILIGTSDDDESNIYSKLSNNSNCDIGSSVSSSSSSSNIIIKLI